MPRLPLAFLVLTFLPFLPGAYSEAQPPKEGGVGQAPKDVHGDRLPEGARVRMGTVRWRLEGGSLVLGFTPDGKGLIVNPNGQRQGPLHILEVPTGKDVASLTGVEYAQSQPASVAASGKLMALGHGNQLDLWDMAARRRLRRIEADKYYQFAIALSPDGKVVATGGKNYEKGKNTPIRLWDVATGQLLDSLEGHPNGIQALMFTADSKRLLSCSPELRYGLQGGGVEVVPGSIRVWDLATRKRLAQYPNASYGVRFAPGGRLWVYQGNDNRIRIMETGGGTEVAQLPPQGATFAFTADGKALATAGFDQPIRLWDATTGKELRQLEGRLRSPYSTLLFAPDGKTLACASQLYMGGGKVRLWDLTTGKEIHPYEGHQDHVDAVAYSPDGKTVASGGRDGRLFLWNAATGKALHHPGDHAGGVTAVDFAPDGKALASAGKDGAVRLWRPRDGAEIRQLDAGGDEVVALRFTADGKSLWACRRQGKVQGWDVSSGRGLAGFECLAKSLHTAVFSPDGTELAYVAGFREEFSGASTIHVCRVPSGKELLAIQLKEGLPVGENMGFGQGLHCWAVTFSPDGRFLATSESLQTQGLRLILGNHTVRVWELATGKQALRVAGLAVPTRRIAFSPDSRLLAMGHGQRRGFGQGDEQVVILRDISAGEDLNQEVTQKGEVICKESGETLRPLQDHVGGLSCLAFAPDGKTLVTGGNDGTLVGWAAAGFAPATPRRPGKISAKELEALWERLAEAGAGSAYHAIGLLEAAPAQAVALLKARLKPAPGADPKRVTMLITNLEDKSFTLRQKAFTELATYAEQAEDALRLALPKSRSLEAQRRIQQLLDRLDKMGLSPEYRRALRALVVLERIGGAEARRVVERLAAGPPTRLTREARLSLERRFAKGGQ